MNEIASSSTSTRPAAQPEPLRPCPFCGADGASYAHEADGKLRACCRNRDCPCSGSFTPEEWNHRVPAPDPSRAALVAALRAAEKFVRGKAQFFGSTHDCGNPDCATCDENRTLTTIRKALADAAGKEGV